MDYNPKLNQPINTQGLNRGLWQTLQSGGIRKIMQIKDMVFIPVYLQVLYASSNVLQKSSAVLIVLRSSQAPDDKF